MDVAVILEYRFARLPNGTVWSQAAFAYGFWLRYLEVFDRVKIFARAHPAPSVGAGWGRVDGERVTFHPVPFYLGPKQYLRAAAQIKRSLIAGIGDDDAIILRLSSPIASIVVPCLRRRGHPFAAEVVGDPHDVFAPGSVRHPLRPLLRWWFPRTLRWQCRQACAVAYVTESALQRRYPAALGAFTTNYSTVELPDRAFVELPRSPAEQLRRPFRLATIGSLEQLYKAPDVQIDAVARCLRGGLDVELVIIGDGRHRGELEERAVARGVAERVTFRGQLPAGEAVRSELDRADLFILPSRTEGLPRAMIEAMARGLPCIGSTVGGIPELLAEEDMVPAGDADALSAKIREVATDPGRMERMSARNLERSKAYRDSVLGERRRAFYRHIRQRTEEWLATR